MKRYEQVTDTLRAQIENYQLRPGEPLPSLRSLSEQLAVSKNTIIHAYQRLEAEGLIEPRPRQGFFVSHSQPLPEVSASPRPVQLGALALNIIRAAARSDLHPLGSADPDTRFPARAQLYKTLAKNARHRAHQQSKISHYQPPPGSDLLRSRLAHHISESAFACKPQEIIITNGTQEGISLSLRAIASQSDIIAVESPSFYGTLQCIEALGLKVVEIPTIPGEGINLCLLEKVLKEWPIKALLLNPNINNPLGFQMHLGQQEKLMAITEPYQLPIIEDDVFGELNYQTHRHPPLKALDTSGRVVLCSSFSKSLDTDIRIGWVIPGKFYEEINYLKYVTTLASSGLTQDASAEFMAERRFARHLRRLKRTYKQRWDMLAEDMCRHIPGEVSFSHPEGGYLSWLELPAGCDGDRIYQQALNEGIAITPGSLFSTQGEYRHCIRLNFSVYDGNPDLRRALIRVSELIRQEIGRL